jgi:hypothetical protein
MRTRMIIAAIVGLGAVLAAMGGAWYLLNQRQVEVCPFSGRVIQPQTRALVTIGGKKYETCCVRCAITEAQQTGKSLRVEKVADFDTGKLLNPANAWFVEGSTVNFCMRMAPAAESPGKDTVYLRAFDRCSPSALAFSDEQHARVSIAQHGGSPSRLDDLLSEVTPIAPKVQKP